MNCEVLKLYDLFNKSKIRSTMYLYDHRKVSLTNNSLGPQTLDVRVDV